MNFSALPERIEVFAAAVETFLAGDLRAKSRVVKAGRTLVEDLERTGLHPEAARVKRFSELVQSVRDPADAASGWIGGGGCKFYVLALRPEKLSAKRESWPELSRRVNGLIEHLESEHPHVETIIELAEDALNAARDLEACIVAVEEPRGTLHLCGALTEADKAEMDILRPLIGELRRIVAKARDERIDPLAEAGRLNDLIGWRAHPGTASASQERTAKGPVLAPRGADSDVPPDRLEEPNLLVWRGTIHTLTPSQWRLLQFMWSRTSAPIEDAKDAVWGHDNGRRDGALRTLISRLNTRISEVGAIEAFELAVSDERVINRARAR